MNAPPEYETGRRCPRCHCATILTRRAITLCDHCGFVLRDERGKKFRVHDYPEWAGRPTPERNRPDGSCAPG